MSLEVLKVENLFKKYENLNRYANNDINLEIFQGEIFGLLGKNGAGKTTLVRQICGLLLPTKGKIYIDNIDIINNSSEIPYHLAYLSQSLYPHRALKVKEFIVYTGMYRGLSKEKAIKQMENLIKYFKIEDLKDRIMYNLSGGETRIIGFIASLMGFRKFIVLDEPTNDMDPEKRFLLWELVKTLKKQLGISFLLVTHNIYEAQDVVDRIAIIKDGEILKKGRPSDIIRNLDMNISVKFELPYNIDQHKLENLKYNLIKIDDTNYKIDTNERELNLILENIFNGELKNIVRNINIEKPTLVDVYLSEVTKNE